MAATYRVVESKTLGSAVSTVTFSSIPQTYTDLVLVSSIKMSTLSAGYLRFNGDTSTNYSGTRSLGSGTSAISDRSSNQTYIDAMYYDNSGFGSSVINVFNYANSTTDKTVLVRWNSSNSSDPYTNAGVGLWRKTPEAITEIGLINPTGNFSIGCTFTLYGIKAE